MKDIIARRYDKDFFQAWEPTGFKKYNFIGTYRSYREMIQGLQGWINARYENEFITLLFEDRYEPKLKELKDELF